MKYNLWRPECTVLFVGYQSNGTLGRTIYEGAKTVRLFGDEVNVVAEAALFQGVSGYVDRDGLLRWVSRFDRTPGRIFVNHGDAGAATAFAAALQERLNVAADAPFSGSVFDLLVDAWETVAAPMRTGDRAETAQTEDRAYDALLAAVRRLTEAAASCRGLANRELNRLTDRVNQIIHDMKA